MEKNDNLTPTVANPMIQNPTLRLFDKVRINIASPEQIMSWSYGEVKKPETINYRTFKPERDGLFCAKIFGPVKDYECLCGKYKRLKHKNLICEKCGVEVTQSKVRRERMGHIELATPVAHIWFLKSLPSRIAMVADLTLKEIESILYLEKYVVIEPGTTDLTLYQTLNEDEYANARDQYGEEFHAMIGAEAVKHMLAQVDIDQEITKMRAEMAEGASETKRKKLVRRLGLMESLKEAGIKPEWMIMNVIPVIPPDLRPLVPLDGGRFASSDLNDLYRRVINRNTRLKKLMDLRAPDIIIRNEKRMLQESVDALYDNGRRGRVIMGSNNKRPLKSLSDMLKGKQGRFRQNLLGKRVDYSGRSVIVVGPELKLHQCGLPKKMALELFKPFVIGRLIKRHKDISVKIAKKLVEKEKDEIWDILEEVIREHPVLLNRAPTLHRLGIQAFEPQLVEGKAIQLHPLVCSAFNADFDGDQMAVHVPLSIEAQLEARVLMMSTNNILSPANGKPIIVPSQDIVLGLYYITAEGGGKTSQVVTFRDRATFDLAYSHQEIELRTSAGKEVAETNADKLWQGLESKELVAHRLPLFASVSEIQLALEHETISINSRIKSLFYTHTADGKPVVEKVMTTAGRMLLSEILPRDSKLPFHIVNKTMTKKEISNLIDIVFRHVGQKETVIFCDKLMGLGFAWACKAGISFGKDDLIVPPMKQKLIADTNNEVKKIQGQYQDGLLTPLERYNKVVDAWDDCSKKVQAEMIKGIAEKKTLNSVFMMSDSGARGSSEQIKQLAGMRGLMSKPSGEIIETPIISNFKEGLSVLEYFNSTHGARKGLADTALKTANAGYLTRRLVDVAQDVIITIDDCGTDKGISQKPIMDGGEVVVRISEQLLGRVLLEDLIDPKSKAVAFGKNTIIDEAMADQIELFGFDEVKVRSPLMCQAEMGICVKCYGRDLARGTPVNIGEAVGIMAAQSIGEPGTQLTMRTFQIGGIAQKGKQDSSIDASVRGKVSFLNSNITNNSRGDRVVMSRNMELIIQDDDQVEKARYRVPFGAKLLVESGVVIERGEKLVEWDPFSIPIIAQVDGVVVFQDLIEGQTLKDSAEEIGAGGRTMIVTTRDKWKIRGGKEELKPQLALRGADGNVLTLPSGAAANYELPAQAILEVSSGQSVKAGDVMARILRDSAKSKDITGGLPRVAELFEARKSKDAAILADQDGVVRIGKDYKAKKRISIEPHNKEHQPTEILISKARQIMVQEGDEVRKGDLIVEGTKILHDILEVMGLEELATYMIKEIKDVYRAQGVKIDDKHIEVIMRQMLQKLEITDPGDTLLIKGDMCDRIDFAEINDKAIAANQKPAAGKILLQGITRASLLTRSFISAASFQETTRVLTDASVRGKVDGLEGLKENVIVGRLIPAGTGAEMRRLRGLAYARDKELKGEMKELETPVAE
ncbi:MAG: DNA-directed RNA polymerase subunit beta' [Hydrotalea sp.]|nr:DNA-directed RNA polymerase subunit beta' [Hydrotalea sp.]